MIELIKKYLNKTGTYFINNGTLIINVKIVDIKVVYGIVKFKIVPINNVCGTGSMWINQSSININPQ